MQVGYSPSKTRMVLEELSNLIESSRSRKRLQTKSTQQEIPSPTHRSYHLHFGRDENVSPRLQQSTDPSLSPRQPGAWRVDTWSGRSDEPTNGIDHLKQAVKLSQPMQQLMKHAEKLELRVENLLIDLTELEDEYNVVVSERTGLQEKLEAAEDKIADLTAEVEFVQADAERRRRSDESPTRANSAATLLEIEHLEVREQRLQEREDAVARREAAVEAKEANLAQQQEQANQMSRTYAALLDLDARTRERLQALQRREQRNETTGRQAGRRSSVGRRTDPTCATPIIQPSQRQIFAKEPSRSLSDDLILCCVGWAIGWSAFLPWNRIIVGVPLSIAALLALSDLFLPNVTKILNGGSGSLCLVLLVIICVAVSMTLLSRVWLMMGLPALVLLVWRYASSLIV